MPDEIRLDDWKRKQVLKLRIGERPSSRHGNCPNWSVDCLLRFGPQQEQGFAGRPAG
jgi:hypothetical protein